MSDLPTFTRESLDVFDPARPTAEERVEIAAILRRAGVLERNLGWMVHTCPSLETAKRLYPPIVAEVER